MVFANRCGKRRVGGVGTQEGIRLPILCFLMALIEPLELLLEHDVSAFLVVVLD